jgi:uncharacterized membrane protein HdeD (DUF308 family)
MMWFGPSRALNLRGLVTIAFGVLLVGWPAISLRALILLFGAFALVDSGLILMIGLQLPFREPTRRVALLAGAVALIVGFVALLWPGPTELVLLLLIALRAIIIGAAEIVAAVRLGAHGSGVRVLAATGLLSILCGCLLLAFPGIGLLAIVWAVGVYAIVIGLAVTTRALVDATTRYA